MLIVTEAALGGVAFGGCAGAGRVVVAVGRDAVGNGGGAAGELVVG